MRNILVINPGSTSTKVAYYSDNELLHQETLRHPPKQLAKFPTINAQLDYRTDLILDWLVNQAIQIKFIDAIIARGGILRPVKAGVYEINDKLLHRVLNPAADHASNLGAQLAEKIRLQSTNRQLKAYIADPPSVDELTEIARVTGIPGFERESLSHALNMRAVCFSQSEQLGGSYYDFNFIVAHIGGGTTLSAHQKGRVIEIISDDEGPMAAERVGAMPNRQLVRYLFSQKTDLRDSLNLLHGAQAGIFAHTGSSSMLDLENHALAGEAKAKLLFEAIAYQVSKSIGSLAIPLKGEIDRIIITGGVAHSSAMIELIEGYVGFLAPITVFPGEGEIQALHDACYRVLSGTEEALVYLDELPKTLF